MEVQRRSYDKTPTLPSLNLTFTFKPLYSVKKLLVPLNSMKTTELVAQ